MEPWTHERLLRLIADQVEESLTVEYKGARALDRKTQQKKDEITKDVSAMANSAGGQIFYGIHEAGHVPVEIEPIDRNEYSKEWLEQIINNVQPRISGVIIHPVPLNSGSDDVAYVVEIPQSTTAHQAADRKYYKRFNFAAEPMVDYEIRDVMARGIHPTIALEFEIEFNEGGFPTPTGSKSRSRTELVVIAANVGQRLANYVSARVEVPEAIVTLGVDPRPWIIQRDGKPYRPRRLDNATRDIVDTELQGNVAVHKYGSTYFPPILPDHRLVIGKITLREQALLDLSSAGTVWWSVYADSAPRQSGSIELLTVPVHRYPVRIDHKGKE